MARQTDISERTQAEGEGKPSGGGILDFLRPRTSEELQAMRRESLRRETAMAIQNGLSIVRESRPDVFYGDFWKTLDEQTKLILFLDWLNYATQLTERIYNAGSYSLEEVMKMYQKLEVEAKPLERSPVGEFMRIGFRQVLEERLKGLKSYETPQTK